MLKEETRIEVINFIDEFIGDEVEFMKRLKEYCHEFSKSHILNIKDKERERDVEYLARAVMIAAAEKMFDMNHSFTYYFMALIRDLQKNSSRKKSSKIGGLLNSEIEETLEEDRFNDNEGEDINIKPKRHISMEAARNSFDKVNENNNIKKGKRGRPKKVIEVNENTKESDNISDESIIDDIELSSKEEDLDINKELIVDEIL